MSDPQKQQEELTIGGLRKRRRELIEKQFGYTDSSNPFNDTELSKPFVWKKKLETALAGGEGGQHSLEARRQAATAAAKVELARVAREEAELWRRRTRERRVSPPPLSSRPQSPVIASPSYRRRVEDEDYPRGGRRGEGRFVKSRSPSPRQRRYGEEDDRDRGRRRESPLSKRRGEYGDDRRRLEEDRDYRGYGERPIREDEYKYRRREESPPASGKAARPTAAAQAEGTARGPVVITAADYLRHTERKMGEIEIVKARREARKIEEAMLEEHRRRVAAERESQAYGEWKVAESQFVRNVAKLRSRLRIEQQREDVVDFWLKELDLSRGFEYNNLALLPGTVEEIAAKLDDAKLEQVLNDVRVRLRVDRQELADARREAAEKEQRARNELQGGDEIDPTLDTEIALQQYTVEDLEKAEKFWQDVRIIVEAEAEQRRGVAMGRIVPFVEVQLKKNLVSKSEKELEAMSREVEEMLRDPTPDVDIDYWELVRAKLPLFRAMGACGRVRREAQVHVPEGTLWAKIPGSATKVAAPKVGVRRRLLGAGVEESGPIISEYPEHYWSPKLLDGSEPLDLGPDEEVPEAELTESEDEEIDWAGIDQEVLDKEQNEILEATRRVVVEGEKQRKGEAPDEQAAAAIFDRFIKREKAIAPRDETILEGDEIKLMSKYGPSDPYVPRKPHYFNRVKTGYEWNRYNQTHYDQENPPPRVVQGYKFCVAYPHLLDPKKTPTWRIEPSDGDQDSVILRFIGGPPYEDLAFRIVKRAWDLNTKRGYRNTFDQGILQLHFNFKRMRYRK